MMEITDYKSYFDLEKVIKGIKAYLPSFDVNKFKKAFFFAEEAHRGQLRKDGKTPYIAHPVAAVGVLTTLHADEDTLISALLHDVPEDTKRTLNEIKEAFGKEIAFLVEGVTKLSKVQYKHNMQSVEVRSLKRLLLHSAKDVRVILIKLSDRLHNMMTLEYVPDPVKRLRIATETMEIYVPIADLLGIRDIRSKLADLSFRYMLPAEYIQIQERLKIFQPEREKNLKKLTKILHQTAEESNIHLTIESRIRNFYSIYKTILELDKTIEDVDDRVGIKLIVDKIEECYLLLGLIHMKFSPLTKRFRDYIANPKPNCYRSLHTTVFGVDGRLTEIQIRTRGMDIEAEYGIASTLFKEAKNSKKPDSKFSMDLKKFSWLKDAIKIGVNSESETFMEGLKFDILQERIIVMTPKGKPVDLPKGASVLDFAYAIHSDLGDHAVKADVNGKIKPISAVLHARDIVGVISDEKVTPELSWLSFVQTNLAKKKILSKLKTESRHTKKTQGRDLLQREMDIANLGLVQNINVKKVSAYIMQKNNVKFEKLDDILVAIGEGELNVTEIVHAIRNDKVGVRDAERILKLTVKIIANNRFGLAKDIYEVLYRYADDMYVFKGWVSRQAEEAYFVAELAIKEDDKVSKMFSELELVDGVTEVQKVSKKGLTMAIVSGISLAILWIGHPIMLRRLTTSMFNQNYPFIFSVVLYVTLLIVFAFLIYYLNLLNKFFPLARHKKMIWVGVFLIPILSTSTLAIEIFYFHFSLSWLIVFVEVLLIYTYLGINYANFLKATRKI